MEEDEEDMSVEVLPKFDQKAEQPADTVLVKNDKSKL
jgi:hypothetical protein